MTLRKQMTQKKSASKKHSSSKNDEKKTAFDLTELSYKKRNKKSRKKIADTENEKSDVKKQDEYNDINTKLKLRRRKRSNLRAKSENSIETEEKLRSKLTTSKSSIKEARYNDNAYDNNGKLLEECFILNHNKDKIDNEKRINSNSFISIESSFKSLSDFNNSSQSISNLNINSNSEPCSNSGSNYDSEFETNSELTLNDTNTHPCYEIEHNTTIVVKSEQESCDFKVNRKDMHQCIDKVANDSEKLETRLNNCNENNNIADDYESLFDELMEEKKINRNITCNNHIKATSINNETESEICNAKNHDNDKMDETCSSINNFDSLAENEVEQSLRATPDKGIEDCSNLNLDTKYDYNLNSFDDINLTSRMNLLHGDENSQSDVFKSKSELNSPNKFSKRKFLYSFANSVWDYMKPVSLDELEKKQSEVSKTSCITEPNKNLSEYEKHLDNRLVIEDSNFNNMDNEQITYNSKTKSYENVLVNVDISNEHEINSVNASVCENMHNFGIKTPDSNSTLTRKSKRQILYKFASSIWDYVKPVGLDEINGCNEVNKNASDYMNNCINCDSKNCDDHNNSNKAIGKVSVGPKFDFNIENDIISDTEFLIDSEGEYVEENDDKLSENKIHPQILEYDKKPDLSTEINHEPAQTCHNKDNIEIVNQCNEIEVNESSNFEKDGQMCIFNEISEYTDKKMSSPHNLEMNKNYNLVDSWTSKELNLNDHLENSNIDELLYGANYNCIQNFPDDTFSSNFNNGINYSIVTNHKLSNSLNSNSDENTLKEFESFNEYNINEYFASCDVVPDSVVKDNSYMNLLGDEQQVGNNNENLLDHTGNMLLPPIKEDGYTDTCGSRSSIGSNDYNCDDILGKINNNIDINNVNVDTNEICRNDTISHIKCIDELLDNSSITQSSNDNQESLLFTSLSTDKLTDEQLSSSCCNPINYSYVGNGSDYNLLNIQDYEKNYKDETVESDSVEKNCNENNANSCSNQFLSSQNSSSISLYSKETMSSTFIFLGNGKDSKKTNKNRQYSRLYKLNKKMKILTEKISDSIMEIREREKRIADIIESRKYNALSLARVNTLKIIDSGRDMVLNISKLIPLEVIGENVEIKNVCKCIHEDGLELNDKKETAEKEVNTEDNGCNDLRPTNEPSLSEKNNITPSSDNNDHKDSKSAKLDEIMKNEIFKVLKNSEFNASKFDNNDNSRNNSCLTSKLDNNSEPEASPRVLLPDNLNSTTIYVKEKDTSSCDFANCKNMLKEKYLKPRTNRYEVIKDEHSTEKFPHEIISNQPKYNIYTGNAELLTNHNNTNCKASIKNGIKNYYLNYYQNSYSYNYSNNRKVISSEYPESNSGSEQSSLEKLPIQSSKYYFYRYYNPKLPEVVGSCINVASNESKNSIDVCGINNYLPRDPNNKPTQRKDIFPPSYQSFCDNRNGKTGNINLNNKNYYNYN